MTCAACRDKKSDHGLMEKCQWEQLSQRAYSLPMGHQGAIPGIIISTGNKRERDESLRLWSWRTDSKTHEYQIVITHTKETTWTRPSSVKSFSRVRLFETPWITAHQASLTITNSQSLLKLMHLELVMPSNHLTLL